MPDLDQIFKAYDIRGITPEQLDADVVELGRAPAQIAVRLPMEGAAKVRRVALDVEQADQPQGPGEVERIDVLAARQLLPPALALPIVVHPAQRVGWDFR